MPQTEKTMIKKSILMISAALLVGTLASCGDPKKSAKGFRLPDGDIEKGKEAFVALACHRCHTVNGVTLPKYEGESPLTMDLGGEVARVKNYGELVTSIINPDHVVSSKYLARIPKEQRKGAKEDSPMPSANDTTTVSQLIDLVAFLQSRYKELAPEFDMDY